MKKILVTNDDGVFSPSLAVLSNELSKLGSVVVVAPDSERSCSSHSISLKTDIEVSSIKERDKYLEVALSGTPVDCVKFGVQNYGPFSLVVSGINNGANLGYHVFYSGTVAAALEGAMFGISSVALSMDISHNKPDLAFAAEFSKEISAKVLKKPLPYASALNINFPDIPKASIKGALLTHQGDFRLNDIFEKNGEAYSLLGLVPPHSPARNSDFHVIREGYISITPIHADITSHHMYGLLRDFEVDLC